MLNESFILLESLKRTGCLISNIHPWIKKSKKDEGLIVGISPESQIALVEYCDPEKMGKMWKVMPDNQRSFPIIN
ncbi:hypothetical protein HYY75_06480 [bacterium]|nr:hypothetical protein [bacterium]